jgi:hypothetical protein
MDCTTRPASDKGRVGVTAVFIFIGLFVLNIVFGKSQLLYSQNIKHTTTQNPFHFRRVNTKLHPFAEAKDWGTVPIKSCCIRLLVDGGLCNRGRLQNSCWSRSDHCNTLVATARYRYKDTNLFLVSHIHHRQPDIGWSRSDHCSRPVAIL